MTVSAAAAAAAGCSALSEVVEAHRQLAAQQTRLDVLQQLLVDKELLLSDARQMVSKHGAQLAVDIAETVTSASMHLW
jgi:hypothetical protein